MKNYIKIDFGLLAIFSITLLLAKLDILPNFIHYFVTIVVAFYFFIGKLIQENNYGQNVLMSISGYVISASLCLLSITSVLQVKNDFLTGTMALLALLHLIGIVFYFSKKINHMGWLHLVTHSIMGLFFL